MGEGYSTPKWWIAAAAASVILTLVLGYSFITAASKGLYKEKVAYLEEISIKGSELVTEQINGYFSTLKAIGTVIGSEEEFKVDFALEVLCQEAADGFFKRMGIILPDGTAYTTDGYITDFNDRDYFHQALAGQNTASAVLIDKIGGAEINVFAAPVYHKGAIAGVIFATKSQEALSKSLEIESFGGKGYSYIVARDGDPVIKTNHPDSIGEYENFFDAVLVDGITQEQLSVIHRNILLHASGVLEYTREGSRRQMFYASVGMNGWYIFSVVPTQSISMQSDRLIRYLIYFAVIMVVLSIVICSGMISFFRRNNEKLRRIAYTDEITGYSNWAGFRLAAEKLLRENPGRRYAMLVFDINKFKLINDLYGYRRGNEILCFVCRMLAGSMREGETFCRAAADHFNLLLQYEGDEVLLGRLRLIEDELEGHIENYKLKISTGICTINEPRLEVSDYSDKANISRKIVKKQNSLSYHFFQDENRIELLHEKEIENVMDAALENGEFLVYLQPKYSTRNDGIVGAEALVRWNRPEEGLLQPGSFIPLFEKNGFIRKLDTYMFENVCRMMVRWRLEFPETADISVSVNISRANLSNPELSVKLQQIASQYGVNPDNLEIELTESAVFENVEEMGKLMEQFKRAGFQLSIDDFGSGYSSLASLKTLPADFVKIDKSFLDAAEGDGRGEKIICSMVNMIRGLGMISVAEGVETREQLDFLKRAGCDIVQGYYWAKPMPLEEFEALVFKHAIPSPAARSPHLPPSAPPLQCSDKVLSCPPDNAHPNC